MSRSASNTSKLLVSEDLANRPTVVCKREDLGGSKYQLALRDTRKQVLSFLLDARKHFRELSKPDMFR
jgi:hypothetical protein